MRTIQEVLNKSCEFLQGKGIASPRRQAEELLSTCLSKSRTELYMSFQQPLDEEELKMLREALKRRGQNEPCQYIHGEVSFYGCQLKVNPNVLIPRQETEILVDKIVSKLNMETLNQKVLWDVGTGSGAIAIALKKRFPKLRVCASDISKEALEVAKENNAINEQEVEFYHGDFLEPLPFKVDYLVSNPPYISGEEYKTLEAEVKDHEPKISLVAENNGLWMYERFAKEIKKVLKSPSKAFFEIGYNQGETIKNLFKNEGFRNIFFEKDYSQNDRFFFLELE